MSSLHVDQSDQCIHCRHQDVHGKWRCKVLVISWDNCHSRRLSCWYDLVLCASSFERIPQLLVEYFNVFKKLDERLGLFEWQDWMEELDNCITHS